ncbi:hypothetical protein F5146DRAFT_935552 [Armillaria mellea]|nr:hypothetical protein F5146DRAFT_935552 [Armillaria mellea]
MVRKSVLFSVRTLLCPGCHQVTHFGPDDDYEEEEEIFYVTLELGNVEPSLIPSCNSYHLVGLDTPTPFLQLAGTVLKGRHETLLSTKLVFSGSYVLCRMLNILPTLLKTQYPTRGAHGSVSASEKCASKKRANPNPKLTLANSCWIALPGNSQLYHAGAGLERWKSSLRITDTIVHF